MQQQIMICVNHIIGPANPNCSATGPVLDCQAKPVSFPETSLLPWVDTLLQAGFVSCTFIGLFPFMLFTIISNTCKAD